MLELPPANEMPEIGPALAKTADIVVYARILKSIADMRRVKLADSTYNDDMRRGMLDTLVGLEQSILMMGMI